MFFTTSTVTDILTGFSITAIILNAILLPLIAFKSDKEIGVYKVLLFLYTLIALIYTSISGLLAPVFETSAKGWLFYATKQRIPREFGAYLISVFCMCYIKLLLVLASSFVYRFSVLCKPHLLYLFHRPVNLLIIVVSYISILVATSGPVFWYMRQNEQVAASIETDPEYSARIYLRNVSYIGFPVFNDGHLVPQTVYIMVAWTCAMMTSTGTSVFCIIQISAVFRNVAKISHLSTASRKKQFKLFFLLILQTLVPLCFTFTPGLLSYALAIAGIHAPEISQTSSALLPLAQVIDPILIFFMIAEYRRCLFKCIRCWSFSTQQSVSVPVTVNVSNVQ